MTEYTKQTLYLFAKELALTGVCQSCFPSDDLNGRVWGGGWKLAVYLEPVGLSLVVSWVCGRGHKVLSVRDLTKPEPARVRARRTKP